MNWIADHPKGILIGVSVLFIAAVVYELASPKANTGGPGNPDTTLSQGINTGIADVAKPVGVGLGFSAVLLTAIIAL